MIDKKGKVFGKINIIDLIVIVVVIAAVAMFAVSKLSDAREAGESANDGKSVYMVFYAEEVSDFVADKLKEGEKVFDNDMALDIGEVVSFETAPAVTYSVDSEGNSVVTTKENYKSVKITAKVDGKLCDYGVEIDDVKYGVGHSMTLRAGYAKIYLRVYDIYTK